jgi:sulfur relay (sulfurtransferase) DsrC/TusE family protein
MADSMRDIMNPGAAVRDAGFPNAPDDWSPASAEAVAAGDGLALSDDHW